MTNKIVEALVDAKYERADACFAAQCGYRDGLLAMVGAMTAIRDRTSCAPYQPFDTNLALSAIRAIVDRALDDLRETENDVG